MPTELERFTNACFVALYFTDAGPDSVIATNHELSEETRHEWWYPVYKVPAHLTNDEALEYAQDKQPDEVYDEYNNKHTYEQECWIELAFEKTQEEAA